jgi:hypothetical protein
MKPPIETFLSLKKTVSNIFYDLVYNLLVLADEQSNYLDRVIAFFKILFASSPAIFLFNIIGGWFNSNKEFSTYVILCILINMAVGGWRHHIGKKGFSWWELLKKTGLMFLVLLAVYTVLEMILKIAKENIVTETFRVALQVSTLMYPGSKLFKSVFILTKGEYPPEWIMARFYKFNKDGDLLDLFNKKAEDKLDKQEENI